MIVALLALLIYFPIFVLMLDKSFRENFGKVNSKKLTDLLSEALLGILYFAIIFFAASENFKRGILFFVGIFIYLVALALTYRGYFVFYKTEGLITNDVYSISRNPTYFFGFVSVLGIASMTLSIKIFATLILAFVFTNHIVANEEKYLENKFKKKFTNYSRKVGRWI